jgi:hypothetical protein
VVLADHATAAGSESELEKAAGLLGARLALADVAAGDGTKHDPVRLAEAYRSIFGGPAGAGQHSGGSSA